jgi:hypothetical protein
MKLYGSEYSRSELMRRVGHLRQVAGIEPITLSQGHSRDVRMLDVRTGSGLRFTPVIDRGFDVGYCEFKGASLAWISPNGFPDPRFYELKDDNSWLRVGLGGLFNTGGLVVFGNPQTIPTEQYEFAVRPTDRYGIHDRIAVTPAEYFAYGEEWQGDTCVLWAEAKVRQQLAYGENLSLTRRYQAELGATSFRIRDVVANEGFFPSPHQMLYHFNIGFPVLDEGAELVAAVAGEVPSMSFSDASEPDPERYRQFSAPQPSYGHEGYVIPMQADADDKVGVAVVNSHVGDRGEGLGVYLRYDQRQLPVYVEWRMMAEGLYAVGIEPCTNPFGEMAALRDEGWPVMLQPGETRTYELEFGVLDGSAAIEAFKTSLPASSA